MKTPSCCGDNRPVSSCQRHLGGAKITQFVAYSFALMVMPKCPVCLAAWITVMTGVSLAPGIAEKVRVGVLLLLCFGLLFIVLSWFRRCYRGVAETKKTRV
ncbi:hypothetical protein SAMN02745166_02446 [Prosthecobacter debontii]|uniref:Uncharacterized protein n=2 Tax=Prosthecobacter debontii TaxID=48467 RepID=A0A1T4Y4C3_9BACT|nr:hypothetical protein SAMN02745166_02446 [Prosthecobacter debontii]